MSDAKPLPRRPGMTAPPAGRTMKDPTSWPVASDGKPLPRVTSSSAPQPINEPEPAPAAASVDLEPGQRPETLYHSPKRTGAVELPSKGRYYGSALPDGVVEVYTLTAVEDKILSELTSDNATEVFDAILARCIKSPVSPPELLDTDRYYLLLVLRANSLGGDYQFPYECPFKECGNAFLHTVQIPSDFTVVAGKATEEPYFVKLPMTGAMVGLRFLRGKDMADIARYRKTAINVDTTLGDPAYAYSRIKSIVSVNGEPFPDISVAMDWYMGLPLKDVRVLQKTEREAASGVSNVVTITCPKCKKESVSPVALSPMYFFD